MKLFFILLTLTLSSGYSIIPSAFQIGSTEQLPLQGNGIISIQELQKESDYGFGYTETGAPFIATKGEFYQITPRFSVKLLQKSDKIQSGYTFFLRGKETLYIKNLGSKQALFDTLSERTHSHKYPVAFKLYGIFSSIQLKTTLPRGKDSVVFDQISFSHITGTLIGIVTQSCSGPSLALSFISKDYGSAGVVEEFSCSKGALLVAPLSSICSLLPSQ